MWEWRWGRAMDKKGKERIKKQNIGNEKNFKVEVKWTDGNKNLIKIISFNQTITVKQK